MEIDIIYQDKNNLRFQDLCVFINKKLKSNSLFRVKFNDKIIDFNL